MKMRLDSTGIELQKKDLKGRFRLSNLQGIDTGAEPVVIEGVEYFPGKTKLRPLSMGPVTIRENGEPVRPEQDGLFSKEGKLLHMGQVAQVRKGEIRKDSFLGPITPIISHRDDLAWDDEKTNDIDRAHWINKKSEVVFVDGDPMEGDYQIYEDTSIGEVMRVNVSKLHNIFANITPEGKAVYIGNRCVDLVGKIQDSVFGEVSLLLPRGRGVGSIVDKELNIVRDWISNIATIQDPKLGLITQMPYSKGVRKNITLDANHDEIDYPESLTIGIVKTSEGIFTNSTNEVLNSSGESLIIGGKKVTKISYGYDMPHDSYMIQFEGDEEMTMIKGRALKGKDLY